MKSTLTLLLFSSLLYAHAQTTNAAYLQAIETGDSLYVAKQHHAAALVFSNAFKLCPTCIRWTDKYNAASNWALAGNADSAFANLQYAVNDPQYQHLGSISTDADLEILHNHKQWNAAVDKVRSNRDKGIAKPDFKLVYMLDTIYLLDQGLRMQLTAIEEKYGFDSKEVKAHWNKIAIADSINFMKVSELLDTRGWLGEDVLGGEGNSMLFLVIQHSPINAQEKYLPMIRDAVIKGNAQVSNLALLEDRVALRTGKKQIYGSQIIRDNVKQRFYVAPLEDPENVDARRAKAGLQPIKDYAIWYGIAWDINKYLEDLPYIEEIQKRTSSQ